MLWFYSLTFSGWLIVVAAARLRRSATFAMFVAVFAGVYSLVALGLAPAWRSILPVYAVLHTIVYVNFLGLSRPRMHALPYRLLISWPAAFFSAGTLLAMPWAIARALGFHPWGPEIPYLLAAIGFGQSLTTKRELVDLEIAGPGGAHAGKLAPHPYGDARVTRPLRIVQISDPHLGPFMSVGRLRKIVERAVAAQPDLVFLTGDFLTMESQGDPNLLLVARAAA